MRFAGLQSLGPPQHGGNHRGVADWFPESWRPGTAKSYLGSVIAFYDFCLAKRKWNMQQELQSAITDLKRVSKFLRKRSLRRRTEKETADIGRFQEQ